VRLAALNQASRAEFIAVLGGVFEHSLWVAEAAFPARPFATIDALHQAMVAAVRSAQAEQRLALLRAHPDLAGKAARSGEMTASSVAEQASAGLLSLSDTEFDEFHRLNAAYHERFGFPFIIAVRQHSKESLLAAFAERLDHPREEEIETALSAIFTITRLRLDALLAD
jgi:2-oxo-4-hydroxy-4-carboxy-5-ureidoimidazoline decarboxylase